MENLNFTHNYNSPFTASNFKISNISLSLDTLQLDNRKSSFSQQEIFSYPILDSQLQASFNDKYYAGIIPSQYLSNNILPLAQISLQEFSSSPDYEAKMNLAFGYGFNVGFSKNLIDNLATGVGIPNIKIIPTDELNALGAFGANTIYLSQDLLNPNEYSSNKAVDVFLEEMGHYIDSKLNSQDSPGDEGAIFAKLVQNQVFKPGELAALKAEDDSGILNINGQSISVEHADLEPGVFLTESTGKITIDFLADAGSYHSEMSVFSLQGMEGFTPGSADFIKEAARRSLTNSPLGYTVIVDASEGAKFSGELGESNKNDGNYSGSKTFSFNAADKVAMMLVPQGTVKEVFDNSSAGNSKRPLFSIAAANPNNVAQMGQLVPGSFGWEDIRADQGTDADYNDIIFQIKGATGTATPLGQLIAPGKDWQSVPLAKEIIAFASQPDTDKIPPSLTAALFQDTGISNSDGITNNPQIVGSLIDGSGIGKFQAKFSSGTNFVDILSELNPDGSFSLDKNKLSQIQGGQLLDGNYQLNFIAEDKFANTSQLLLNFTLDTNKPSAPTDIGIKNNSDTVTNQKTPTITGKGETGALIELFDGQTKLGQAAVVNGVWEITPTTELSNGVKNLTVIATDIAGNKSDTATKEITIDTIAPQLNITGPQANAQLTAGTRLQGIVNGTGSKVDKLSYRFNSSNEINIPVNDKGEFDVEFNLSGSQLGEQNLVITAKDLAGNSQVTTIPVVVKAAIPTTIAASLLNDTGISTSDGITSDSTIKGTVNNISQIVKLQAKLNSGNFVDVLSKLNADGSFNLDKATLTQINGGQLPDGSYQLTLKAEDKLGNASNEVKLDFTLDTTAPQTPGWMLDSLFDSAPIGDSQTTFDNVNILGQTEANAIVTLQGTGTSITANATGRFQFSNVSLALGDNSFTVNAKDTAGNTSTFTTIIKRVAQGNSDVVLDWNATLLNAIYTDKTAPPLSSRNMAMVQTAVFDAVNSFSKTYKNYHFNGTAPTGASVEAAAASAAYRVLVNLYPNQKTFFDTALTNSLSKIPDGAAEDAGVAFGKTVADDILSLRSADGANITVNYTPGNNPGDWQPTAPAFATALLPQWGQVTPFALTSGQQFRPAGEPALTSDLYTADFNQVKELGSSNSTTRTADQTQIAQFWADGTGTFTPPGHWNQIAQNVAAAKGNSLVDNARLFALLDISLADAGIAAWDAKYTYNFWRPITAIQKADTDGNPNTIADPNWTPLLTTPPFPEYISGHSTFSGAAATVLTGLLGNNVSFTTNSLGTPGVYRTFTNFNTAASEAGISRIYGGIHFNTANVDGLATGKLVGNYVLQNLLAPVAADTTPPTVAISSTPSTANSYVELTFNEAVTDTSFAADKYSLKISGGTNDGQTVQISSVQKLSSTQVRLNLATAFTSGIYKLNVASGITDLVGNATTTAQIFDINIATAPVTISPTNGEEMVGLNRETVVNFGKKVDPATVKSDNFYLIANGKQIQGTIKVSSTEEFATFFYDNPLPSSTEVRVVVDGSKIIGRDGVAIDGDGDGKAGGIATADFTTLPITRIKGTDVWGYVYDSYNKNPDGSNIPIKGVTIRLDSLPDVKAVTDDKGYFILKDVPAPEFFVYIDGSTATGAPAASQYASLGKPFHSVPGQSTQLFMDGKPFNVYLPPMAKSDVKQLSATEDTKVGFGDTAQAFLQKQFPAVDPELWKEVKVTFNPGSAQDDKGNKATQATIIPVDPNRLPAPLPPGVDPKLVISIQAGGANGFNREAQGGATNFDVPAPIQFPNLDGLKPGEKSLFWSFDHDAGKWIVIGTGTVSEDGKTVVSDPGVGVLAPGWHFVQPGVPAGKGNPAKPDDCGFKGGLDGADGKPKSGQIDRNFLGDVEGKAITKGYVPQKNGEAIEQSGVTIGTGFDLGQHDKSYIDSLDISDELKNKLYPYLGKNKQDAIDFINENPLQLSPEEVDSIDTQVINGILQQLAKKYNAESKVPFDQLPPEAQTVLYSVEHQYGNAKTKTPNFWRQMTQQKWQDAVNNLKDFGDAYPTRRNKEANLLNKAVEREKNQQKNGNPCKDSSKSNGGGTPVGSSSKKSSSETPTPAPNLKALAFATEVSQPNDLVPLTGKHYFAIFNLDRDTIDFRGSSSNGIIVNEPVVLAPNTNYRLFVLQADTQADGYYDFHTSASGNGVGFGDVVLSQSDLMIDSDNDGLSNMAEFIIGTDGSKYSTSDDGISDGAKLQQGLDPLSGRGFPTGIISSLPLQGEAKAVTVAGSTTNSQTQTAYVATGSYGLAVVNASQFNNPSILGQLNLPGDATDVAVDTKLNIAAVATNSGGLQLVNVADGMLPTLNQTINLSANQVEIADGIAYATVGTTLKAIDLLSGQELQSLTLPGSGTVTGLAREGTKLYAYVSGSDTFSAVDITVEGAATVLGQLNVNIASSDVGLSVGNGVAYLAGSGLRTIDISNPNSPKLISDADNFFTARGVTLNGSGLALVSAENQGLAIYNSTDPQKTDAFLTVIDTPGFTYNTAVASGIAFVADGTSGLQVINYLPFDNKGKAPTVTINTSAIDLDPNTPGIQVQEGSAIPIRADITDDVQVRNVELLVDGAVVTNDVSFPWDLSVIAPKITTDKNTVNIQVRATDTGGNIALSNLLTLNLSPDKFAPTVIATTPNEGAKFKTIPSISVKFNEAIDSTKLNVSGITLTNLGKDGVVGGGDDVVTTVSTLQTRNFDRTLVILPGDELPVGNYQLKIDPSIIADRAGNALTNPISLNFTKRPLITPLNFGTIITGSLQAGDDEVYTFNGTAGQRLLFDSLDNNTSNIYAQITSPSGISLNNYYYYYYTDSQPFTLTETGTYRVTVKSSTNTTSNYNFRLIDASTAPTITLGTTVTDTLTPGRESDIFKINGTKGQRLFFDSLSNNSNIYWRLYGTGNQLINTSYVNGYDFEATLPNDGSYLLVLDGNSNDATVNYSFKVTNPPTTTTALTLGNTITSTISQPGEIDEYTFIGTVGQRLYYDGLINNNSSTIYAQLISPSGQTVFYNGDADSDRSPFTLTETGTYKLVLDGYADNTGDYSFRLVDAGAVPTITLDTTVTNTLAPGLKADVYRINGTAGQRLFFNSLTNLSSAYWTLYAPGNQSITGNYFGDFETTLTSDGTYLLVLSGNNSTANVNYSFKVTNPPTTTTALTIGNTVTSTISQPGEVDEYTFTGTAGQRLYYDGLINNNTSTIYAQLISPSGQTVFSNGDADSDRTPVTLTENGTYKLVVDGYSNNTGDYSFRLIDAGAATNLVLNSTITGTLDPGLKTEIYRINGTAGQKLNFDSLVTGSANGYWYLYNTNNQSINGASLSSDFTATLPSDGTYLLVLNGYAENGAVNYKFQVTDISDAPVTKSGFNTVKTGTIAAGGQDTYTLTAPAGLLVYFDGQKYNTNNIIIDVRDANNQSVTSFYTGSDTQPIRLNKSGTYTLTVKGINATTTGNYSFQAIDIQAAATDLSLNTLVTKTLTNGAETVVYRFNGTSGQKLYYDALQNDADTVDVQLISPSGVNIFSGNSDYDSSLLTLTETGTYYLLLKGNNSSEADYSFRLIDASTAPTITLGTTVTDTLTPGLETDIYRINGTARQRLFFDSLANTTNATWTLYSPTNQYITGNSVSDFETKLTSDGTYLLALTGYSSTGNINYSFKVTNPATTTTALTLGNTVTSTISQPGEIKEYTFTGTAGQLLYYDALINNNTYGINTQLISPTGQTVLSNSDANSDRTPFILTETGTYKLVLDGNGNNTGDYSFRLIDASTAPTITLGTTVTDTLTPGLKANVYQINGTAGQKLFFDSGANTINASWTLYNPNSQYVTSTSLSSDFETTLTSNGTYLLVLNSSNNDNINYSFKVTNPPTTTTTLTLGNTVTSTISQPGEVDEYTFTGTAGQRLYYDALISNNTSIIYAQLISPSGQTVFYNGDADTDRTPFTLTETGTYKLILDGYFNNTGDYSFRLLDTSTVPTITLDTIVTNTLNPGLKADVYRINAKAGQKLRFDSLITGFVNANWTLYAPGNNQYINSAGLSSDFEATLPGDGTYILVINGSNDGTINYKFQITEV